MKATWFEQFGAAKDVLHVGQRPDPTPNDGEVLVELHTSGVNPSDVKKRAGSFPDLLDRGFVIPHSDGAGVIADVGSGVSKDRIGQRVWVYQAQYGRRFGTAAQLLSLPEHRAVLLPDNASFDVGACLGIPAMTAHRCVFADGSVAGKRVLITGGAGRVGHYAIQWAKQDGAFVIATASNPDDHDACLSLGADVVVNHRESHWAQTILEHTNGKKLERIVDVEFGGNLNEVLDCVDTGATIASYASMANPEPKLPFFRMMYLDLTVRLVIVYAMPEEAKSYAVRDITDALERDALKHRIAHRIPLDDIAASHELIEQGGFRGCVINRCR
ncbi:MAG: NADPH:quinone reductase [Pseudomonadota bacterium]